MSRAEAFITAVGQVGVYAFDIEYEPELSPYEEGFKLAGVSFATEVMEFYETDMMEVQKVVSALFPTDAEAVAYNAKSDLKGLVAAGLITSYSCPKNLCDPMIGVNLLDENRQPNEMGLKVVVYDQYGYKMKEFEEVVAAHGIHSREFAEYSIDDARWEYRLHKDIKRKLVEEDLWQVFVKILMRMSKVAADMEWCGVGWDINRGRELLRGFQVFRKKMEDEIIGEIGQLNLGSGDQIAKRLFDDLGYDTRGIQMTDSGKRYSTDATAMETLARKYPVADKIVKYRTCDKMISTFVEPLTRMAMGDRWGRVHPQIWLTSKTGRSRMEKPNFQQIPAWLDKSFSHLSIRSAIVPPPGWSMIVAVLSQIELRLCGHISQDPYFLAAYRNWECTACNKKGSSIDQILHKCPECGWGENEDILKSCPVCKTQHVKPIKQKIVDEERVIGCHVCVNKRPYDDVKIVGFWHGEDLHQQTTDAVSALDGDRQAGKTANFALIYYATPVRMHYAFPKFSIDQWEEIDHQFFTRYSGVKRWQLALEAQMNGSGICRSLFGRKRRVTRLEIKKSYKHTLNMFINFGVQCSAAEYIQLCMANLREKWVADGTWMREVYQSNFIHDECVYEVRDDLVEKYRADIVEVLENSVRFQVPIRTGIKVVKKWSDAKG